jgi:hypothetical protein
VAATRRSVWDAGCAVYLYCPYTICAVFRISLMHLHRFPDAIQPDQSVQNRHKFISRILFCCYFCAPQKRYNPQVMQWRSKPRDRLARILRSNRPPEPHGLPRQRSELRAPAAHRHRQDSPRRSETRPQCPSRPFPWLKFTRAEKALSAARRDRPDLRRRVPAGNAVRVFPFDRLRDLCPCRVS